MDESPETHAAVGQAIADHLSTCREGVVVTKWLVVAEIVSASADFQELTTISADNMSTWDASGMAGFVEARCKHWFADDDWEDDS